MFRASQALKSLPWADQDEYRISYADQLVHFRVEDMKRFDEKQLLAAFHGRELVPAWLEAIMPLPQRPAVAADVLRHDAVKALEGDWRNDDSASRKFWLTMAGGRMRLHTTRHGYWCSSWVNVLAAGQDWIRYRARSGQDVEMRYRRDGDKLSIQVPPPGDYQGEFTLFRGDPDAD